MTKEKFVVDGKVITPLCEGKVVVSEPVDNDKVVVPLFCPLCDYPMKTATDAKCFKEHKMCELCVLYWNTGKPGETNPDKTSERWQMYMERRHMAFLPSIRFK